MNKDCALKVWATARKDFLPKLRRIAASKPKGARPPQPAVHSKLLRRTGSLLREDGKTGNLMDPRVYSWDSMKAMSKSQRQPPFLQGAAL